MAVYSITQPQPTLVRVFFPPDWDAAAESAPMFKELLTTLNAVDDPITLVIIAGDMRPIYSADGLRFARDILLHDNVDTIIIVADDPKPGVAHMSAFRGERGFPPVHIIGCTSEAEVEQYLR